MQRGSRTSQIDLTVAAAVEKYIREAAPNVKNRKRYFQRWKSSANHAVEELGPVPLAAVSKADLEMMAEKMRRAGLAPVTASQAVQSVSTLFKWCQANGSIDREAQNPAYGIRYYGSRELLEYLSADEVVQFVEAARTSSNFLLFPAALTVLEAGLRKGEVFGLRRDDVDLNRNMLTVARSYDDPPKSGKPRWVPITPVLSRILPKQLKNSTHPSLVFPISSSLSLRMGRAYDMLEIREALERGKCHQLERPWPCQRRRNAAIRPPVARTLVRCDIEIEVRL